MANPNHRGWTERPEQPQAGLGPRTAHLTVVDDDDGPVLQALRTAGLTAVTAPIGPGIEVWGRHDLVSRTVATLAGVTLRW